MRKFLVTYMHTLYFAFKGASLLGLSVYATLSGQPVGMDLASLNMAGLGSLLVAAPLFLVLDTIGARLRVSP